ncbi:MAG: hypothetical protein HYZ72_19360 [Deltaproteobacteria bacterium]|nr:hypothetical protein [Deltaproteobacteria bacterium]
MAFLLAWIMLAASYFLQHPSLGEPGHIRSRVAQVLRERLGDKIKLKWRYRLR